MDEVRAKRLFEMHGKSCLLIIIRDWPLSDKYRDQPYLVASLEYLVNILNFIQIFIIKHIQLQIMVNFG